ncbi:TrmH family RNA methyltransferase [Patescibacteria group bacterium]
MVKLNAQQLRHSNPSKEELEKIKRNPIYLILDRIIDTYNVGSLFRLADAIACKKVYLCGDMEYPPSTRIHKAAVGTEQWTPWEKKDSTLKTIKELKKKGVQIIAVEQDSRSISYKDLKSKFPCAIVVGAETGGMQKEVLSQVDTIVELPMYGVNKSFNVWGSGAIVAYKIIEELL